jgi:hypothetical protein
LVANPRKVKRLIHKSTDPSIQTEKSWLGFYTQRFEFLNHDVFDAARGCEKDLVSHFGHHRCQSMVRRLRNFARKIKGGAICRTTDERATETKDNGTTDEKIMDERQQ